MEGYKLNILTITIVLICFTLLPKHGDAVTANPARVKYTQPDGTSLILLLKGDEFIHWATTLDGYTILSNKQGYYEYASLDSIGNLGFSGIQAHNDGQRSQSEQKFLRGIRKGLFFSETQINEMEQWQGKKNIISPMAPMVGGFPTTGTRKLLQILANFSNATTTYTQADFDSLMNQDNYNGTGSFRDYYIEVSYGQLTVNTTVTIWVNLPQTHDYYGSQAKWGEFAYDAVVAADVQAAVNFAEFDNNSDGIVDGVAIIHQGRGQEESGNINDIWSHSSDLASAGYTVAQRTFDGVQVLDYSTMPEKNGTSNMTTIGVICHEFGHNLGSPDFYDTDYETNGQYDGTGNWDVMANGSWNGVSGSQPAHPNAWIKNFFTWTNPAILTTEQIRLLRSAQLYPDVFRYNTTTTNEYFLCENRQQTGFDAGLPGYGLMIYHVDGSYIAAHTNTNDINANSHQGMFPMSAVANTTSGIMPSASSNINTEGCPWPGTESKTTFSDGTIPNSKSWAGANTDKPLLDITENMSTNELTVCFIACDTNDPINFTATAVSSSQIDLSWIKNPSNDSVMVAFSLTSAFGIPVTGTTYSSGDTIPGGGTVLYNGSNTIFNDTSLSSNTTYYYMAWSVMTVTTYSTGVTTNATTFSAIPPCPGFPTVTYEGQTYNTVQIGQQCWLKENLNIGTLTPGSKAQTNNDTIEKYCNGDLESNCDVYGGLYQWDELMQYVTTQGVQGICPTGWHIPSYEDFTLLTDNLGGLSDAGGKMKEIGVDHWHCPNIGATNSSGFTAIAGGFLSDPGLFVSPTFQACFWPSSENVTTNAWSLYLNYGNNNALIYDYWEKTRALSVRCVMNAPNYPTVTTNNITNISQTNAISGGNVIEDGGFIVTERGVCWSTSSNPTIYDNHTIDGAQTGEFLSNISGLTEGTIYFLRAYATNSMGTAYGNKVKFASLLSPVECGNTITYEGKTYNTVQIGIQCWFKENLNIGTQIDTNVNQTNNGIIEKYCYNNLETNCTVYGGLYQWNEMMQYTTTEEIQGICLTGWHIPSNAEWWNLSNYLGSFFVVGGLLKETGFEHWLTPNTGAINSSGFTAIPGGLYEKQYSLFTYLTTYAHFWSSSDYDTANAKGWYLQYNSNSISWSNFWVKSYGFSVRCLKNSCLSYTNVGINIVASANPVNTGTSVSFTATPTNGGPIPVYQWKVNGITVGVSSVTYSYIPANNDSITCVLTSNLSCTRNNPATSNQVTMTVNPLLPVEQVINIQSGWSGISSYIDPMNDSIASIFNPIISDLVILMNMSQLYWPGQGINTIGTWNTHQGYKIKVDNEVQLTFSGVLVNDRVVELPMGWSLIPVLNNDLVPADDIFSSLGDTLTIVKEIGGGEVYWPAQQIFTLQYLIPGKAYCIHVSYPCSIEYPEYSQTRSGVMPDEQSDNITPWNDVWSTPNSHTIAIDKSLLSQFKPGDVIGIFNNSGLCCGMISLDDLQSNTAITAFGDDNTTGIIDGFIEDEFMSFNLYRPGTLEEFYVFVTYDQLLPDKEFFTTNGLSKIAGINLVPTSSDLSGIEDCLTIYPNPTGGIIYLTNHCLLGEVDIKIYNDHGQLVMDDHISYTTLHKTFQLDLTGLRKGVYVVKLTGTDFAGFKKVVKF